jgi:hypothetical protein
MRLFGYEHTWDNLYKVHEVMKEDVGAGEIKVHFPNGCRLETFTRTANARRAAGDGARHGHEKNEPPKNPMSLAEARDLIRGWLAHWLASK